MSYPATLKYSKDDAWVNTDSDGGVRVGITTQAVRGLTGIMMAGNIAAVQLPAAGARLAANAGCGAVEGSQAISELVCPIAGTVVAVNGALADSPNLLRDDPYGDGWIFKLKLDNTADLNGLMTVSAYAAFVGNNG